MRKKQRTYTDPHLLWILKEENNGGSGPITGPPVFQGGTFNATSSNDTVLDVDPPTELASGYLWVVILCTDAAETVSAPDGTWSPGATTDPGAPEQPTASLFYKIADGTEVAEEFSWPGAEQAIAYSLAFSNAVYDDSTVDNISTNGTDIDSPAITVAENNSLVCEFGIGDDNNPGSANWSTLPSGTALIGIQRSGASGGVFIEGIYNQQNAGAASVGSWVMSTTRPRSTISLSISPA